MKPKIPVQVLQAPSVNTYEARMICHELECNIRSISIQILKLWFKISRTVFLAPNNIVDVLRKNYCKDMEKYYARNVVTGSQEVPVP